MLKLEFNSPGVKEIIGIGEILHYNHLIWGFFYCVCCLLFVNVFNNHIIW